MYGTDVAYYALGQAGQISLASGARPIRTTSTRGEKGRGATATRPGSNRNNYLGYSAGKATYGRYYAKNNLERPSEANAVPSIEVPYQINPVSVGENVMPNTMLKPSTGISAIAAANVATAGQSLPQYAATVGQSVPQIIPTVPTVVAQKTSEIILEELCQRHLWGTPTYQLLTTSGPDNIKFYLYKVSIPAIANLYPQQPYFQVSIMRFYITLQQARLGCTCYICYLLLLF